MYARWLKSHVNVVEHTTPATLPVRHGVLPPGVRGTLYRNGPGVFVEHDGTPLSDVLDGDGVVVRFHFNGASVTMTSRRVETAQRAHERARGRRLYSGAFGSAPHGRPLKNPANTNILRWGDALLALCECGPPHVLDPDTLETRGVLPPFAHGLPVTTGCDHLDAALLSAGVAGHAVCAHPKVVGDALVLYALRYAVGHTEVTFYELNTALRVTRSRRVRLPGFAYFHDFMVTDTHYAFYHHALRLELSQALQHGIVKSMASDSGGRGPATVLHAVPRGAGAHRTVHAPSGFITHHALVSQDERALRSVSVVYPEPFRMDVRRMMHAGQLHETVWDFKRNTVTRTRVTDAAVEFPCSDGNGVVYGVVGNSLARVNTTTSPSTVQRWDVGPGSFFGEPVLVGGGHVAATLFDSDAMESTLLLFDTRSISSGPVAELLLPCVLPVGLHGSFAPS